MFTSAHIRLHLCPREYLTPKVVMGLGFPGGSLDGIENVALALEGSWAPFFWKYENPMWSSVKVTWVLPKIGVPPNGWFIMENPIKRGMIWGYTYFWKHPHSNSWYILVYLVLMPNCLFASFFVGFREEGWHAQNDSGGVGQWPKAEIKPCTSTVMSCLVAMCSHAAMP